MHARSHKHRRRVLHKKVIAAKQIAQEIPTPPALPDETISTESPILGGQPLERKHSLAEDLHDWILGGQDGIVNVLGSILGVAVITQRKEVIIVAGLAALFAESISMAAVAYTSVKASHSYYHSERERVRREIEENPTLQREVLIDVYERKGFPRAEANRIVDALTKNKDVWLDTIMEERMKMSPPEDAGPLHSAFIVGMASLIGSIIPVIPFFFLEKHTAMLLSCITSVVVLFALGAASAKLTIGNWKTRGLEMAIIGGAAAAVSFAIGWIFTTGLITV
jgi:vacuolar iron transporter family protein